MSDPPQSASAPAAARRRPGTVSAANLLLLTASAAAAADGVIGLRYAGPVTDAFQRAYSDVDRVQFSELSIRLTGGILLMMAAGLALLALLNHRGSGAGRLNTWVLGVVVLCWGGSSLGGDRGVPRDAPDPDRLQRLLTAALPPWVEPVTTASMAVTVSAVLAAMVLLALPTSHRFFRAAAPAGD